LPLKVVVLAFNACVCNVHDVRSQESRPLIVWDLGLSTWKSRHHLMLIV
jgi:hypothetical protein